MRVVVFSFFSKQVCDEPNQQGVHVARNLCIEKIYAIDRLLSTLMHTTHLASRVIAA